MSYRPCDLLGSRGGDDNYPQVEETDQDKLCTSGKGGQSTFAEILFETQ